jgi:hypothetical protein
MGTCTPTTEQMIQRRPLDLTGVTGTKVIASSQ